MFPPLIDTPNMSKQQWKTGFDILKQPGIYELTLGDLVPPGIAYCTRKNLLIFNTSPIAHSPIYVVPASAFGGNADTEIPVCLAYNQSHYECLVPSSDEDVEQTVVLTNKFLNGEYSFKMDDVPIYKKQETNLKTKYDVDFPVLGPKRKKLSIQPLIMSPPKIKDLKNQDGNVKNKIMQENIFQNNLPIHLINKRQRDMNITEKNCLKIKNFVKE